MSRRYNNDHDKSQENASAACAKCGDCFLVSDSSDNRVCKCDVNVYSATTTEKSDEHSGVYRVNAGGQGGSTVKIVVKAPGVNVDRKDASTSETPELYDDKGVSTDTDCKNPTCKKKSSNFGMKHLCFSFCNADNNKAGCDKNKCRALKHLHSTNNKGRKKKTTGQANTGCPQLDQYLNDIAQQGSPPGYNPTTIMVPKKENGGCGDCCCFDFECCVKGELCNQTRLLNDITAEMNRMRNDLKDVRESLECIMRLIRDQSLMTLGKGNNVQKMIDECIECKTCLDRKSKATSLASREDNTPGNKTPNKKRKPSKSRKPGAAAKDKEKKWWRCWWPWC